MAAGERTEKATPRKRLEARKKGQVARSAELNGATSLMAGLLALGSFGPGIAQRCEEAMRASFAAIANPQGRSLHGVAGGVGKDVLLAVAPIALACLAAGLVTNVAQVGFRPSAHALKPDPSRINPLKGAKNLFGASALVEAVKAIGKVLAVGAVVFVVLKGRMDGIAALVGSSPAEIGAQLGSDAMAIARYGGLGWLLIAIGDYAWQRRKFEKSLRMDRQEVKEEAKEHQLPTEVRGAIRRRQMQLARSRMMAAVPQADVVVTNPTHFSVALKYDPAHPAPQVVAKGQDHVALRIRELAREHGVPVVPDPPLARALHGSVEVGAQIPEELYQAVARVLAFVYRLAARRRAAA
jgi:flagellar biosynthesis protein FlhB